jgi:vitamin K-dependent gamma-carboxylase
MTRLALMERLNGSVHASGVVFFRIAYGLIVAVGALRFLAEGWVDAFFVKPTFFFTFDFASWVEVGPPWLMTATVVALAVLGFMVALGLFYRFSIVALVILFTYLELTDVTHYLNHYYQLILLGTLLCFMPVHRFGSLDAKFRPSIRCAEVKVWMVYLLRFQVGIVYVFAAFAKLNSDWLIHAQPLNIWLLARTDTPIIGPLLGSFDVALAFSWLGFLNDLLAVPALLWRRSRPWAYGILLCFHVTTGLLFNIGLFPVIMIATAPIFFRPDWPRSVLNALKRRTRRDRSEENPSGSSVPTVRSNPLGHMGLVLVAIWCVVQVAIPLRALAYAGPVNWHEQGMRFSWRVMVRKKSGAVTYRVRSRERPRDRLVFPSRYLTAAQEREMAGQPDLIVQLAHHIAADFRAQGLHDVEVRADAMVSWNGRPARRLIDLSADLTKVHISFFKDAEWILPAPTDRPIRLGQAKR